MYKVNIKIIALITLVSLQLVGGTVYASHDLEKQVKAPPPPSDGHISWREFRKEMGVYPMVRWTIDRNGVITLFGHVDSGQEREAIESLSKKIRGLTNIRNLIDYD